MLLKSVLISALIQTWDQIYEASCEANHGYSLQSFSRYPLNWLLRELREDSWILDDARVRWYINECKEVEFSNPDGWLWSEARACIQRCWDKHSFSSSDEMWRKNKKECYSYVYNTEGKSKRKDLYTQLYNELVRK